MNVVPKQAGYLWDILAHARDIQSHLAGLSKEEYHGWMDKRSILIVTSVHLGLEDISISRSPPPR